MKISFHLRSKLLKIIVVLFVALLVVGLLLLAIKILDEKQDEIVNGTTPNRSTNAENTKKNQQLYYNGVPYQLDKDVEAVLVLGLDKFEESVAANYHRNDQQSDVAMLMVLNHRTKQYTVLNINRDTMVRFNTVGVTGDKTGAVTAQLALAHTYFDGDLESCYNVRDAVKYLLYGQVEIPYVMSLKMDAVPLLNDAVGGVTVELLDDFSEIYQDDRFQKGETVTLIGDQALDYVRERGALENNTNEDRMKRQTQYLTNWRTAFYKARQSDEALLLTLLKQLDPYMVTNVDSYEIGEIVDAVELYESQGILTLQGESAVVDGHTQFQVDEAALKELVVDLFYEPVSQNK